jgi:hypothetical protein
VIYGTPVRFTVGPLGALAHPKDERMIEATVTKGDEGTYYGRHPKVELANVDWHIVAVERETTIYVPVYALQFEAI